MFKFNDKNHAMLNMFKVINKNTRNKFIYLVLTAQKMKFFIKSFFSKCNKIPSFLRIWSHLLKKNPLWKTFFFVQCLLYYCNTKTTTFSIIIWYYLVLLRPCIFLLGDGFVKPWTPAHFNCIWGPPQRHIGNLVKPLWRSSFAKIVNG